MDIRACCLGEALEEILDQFGLELPDGPRSEVRLDDAKRAAAKIDGCGGQCFVHGHQEISCAENAALRSERGVDRFTEGDADVLDGVVLVNLEIAGGLETQIEAAVARDEIQHVIEETNSRRDVRLAAAIEAEAQIDLRLFGVALNVCISEH